MKKLIAVSKVRPGQEFLHYGQAYRRATDDEAERHHGNEMAARRGSELIFCYQGDTNPMAITFVPHANVVVEVHNKRSRK